MIDRTWFRFRTWSATRPDLPPNGRGTASGEWDGNEGITAPTGWLQEDDADPSDLTDLTRWDLWARWERGRFHYAASNLVEIPAAQPAIPLADASHAGLLSSAGFTKLRDVEPGAQKNAPHSASFSAVDSDTVPASGMLDGEIGIYNGATQLQVTDIAAATVLYLPRAGAMRGHDPGQPGVETDAVNNAPFLSDLADGGQCIVTLTRQGTSSRVFFVCGSVEAYGSHWQANVASTAGSFTAASGGVSWDVFVTPAHPEASSNIVDWDLALADHVRKSDLEGHEDDEFASYTNGAFGSSYFPGNWCLFTGTTQPTDDTRAIRGPDIATGSGVLVWGDLRADSNPDTSWTPEALVAADWPSGRVIHVSPWHPFNNDGHIRITLTSAAALVGTGNGAHLWAQASWTVVGSLTPTLQSDYYRWSEFAPSTLDAEFPPSVIPNAPWVKPTGTSKTDATLSNDDKLLLDTGDDVEVGELYEHHDLFHSGLAELTGYTQVANSAPPTAGDAYVSEPVGVNTGSYSINPASDDDKDLLLKVIRSGKAVRYAVSGSNYVEFKPNSAPAYLFGRLSGTIPPGAYELVGSAIADGTAISLEIESRIPARDELRDSAFKDFEGDLLVDGASWSVSDNWTTIDLGTGTDYTDYNSLSFIVSAANSDNSVCRMSAFTVNVAALEAGTAATQGTSKYGSGQCGLIFPVNGYLVGSAVLVAKHSDKRYLSWATDGSAGAGTVRKVWVAAV